MESFNNNTLSPLGANKTYIGTYDNTVEFATAKISLIADTDMEIIAYQSQNRITTYETTYQTTAGTQFEQYLTLSAPFLYFTCRNKSATAQTLLNFTVIYSTTQVSLSGGVSSDVNISASNGDALTSNGLGALDVMIKNTVGDTIPVSDAVLDACINTTTNRVAVNVEATVPTPIQAIISDAPVNLTASTQGVYTMLDVSTLIKNTGLVNQATQFVANVINDFVYNIGSIGMKQVSLFGKVVDWKAVADGTTANLYIFYSIDAGTGIYRTSLGPISFTKVASPTTYEYDFSRDWATGVKILYLMCDQTIDIDIGYSFSS
jgi:hypothetical protein